MTKVQHISLNFSCFDQLNYSWVFDQDYFNCSGFFRCIYLPMAAQHKCKSCLCMFVRPNAAGKYGKNAKVDINLKLAVDY